jgi:tRNA pseudouridine38-40 synthase
MLVAYDGTAFAGYAVQPGLRTVQGEIEAALERVVGEPVRVATAGRTDAGVHATGQVVSFPCPVAIDAPRVQGAVGSRLPDDISILDVQDAPDGFHARHSCVGRSYVFLIWNHPSRHPLLDRYVVREDRPLDVNALDDAMRAMVGTHDFSSLARLRDDQEPVRTVLQAGAERDGDLIRIYVTARSFLHQMVRNMVGTALEVGLGRRPVGWVDEVLASRDRAAAGQTLPPRGLTLVEAEYEDIDWPNRPAPVGPWAAAVARAI